MANSQQAIEAGKDALNVYNSKDHPRAFARAMANLGSAYLTRAQIANRPLDRADDCRQAIASYQEALMVYKLDRFPEEFALIKNNLAIAYLALSDALEGGGGERRGEDRAIDVREGEGREVEEKEGEERVIEDEEAERREVEGGEVEGGEARIELCNQSIQACREALLIRTVENMPLAYAATQNNLGSALLALAEEVESLENCDLALEAFGKALAVYKSRQNPTLHTATLNNLGSAYLLRAQVLDRSDNCLKAIRAAQEALSISSQESSPGGYAESQRILWLSYLTLGETECRAESCLLALEACQKRLAVYSAKDQPWDFASCQKELAITYSMLAEAEDSVEAKAEDCRRGAQAAIEALAFFTEREHPHEHAEAQLLLWSAYSALAEVEDKVENCRLAIDACRAAIRIYEGHSPAEHADAHKSLGYSFITLAEAVDKADNCRRAIDAYSVAMEYYTADLAPGEHAEILRDLAYAYITISEVEDREKWGRKALRAYKKASRIFEALSLELEAENDPESAEMRKCAERCRRSMESCKGILKASRRTGSRASTAGKQGSG